MASVSERLKLLRKEHKLSQKDVSQILGISESGYGYYEQGRNEPSIDMINKLADRYNVTADYLLGRSDSPDKKEKEDAFDPMDEINRLLKEYGIEHSGFFDIESWKAMGPDEVKQLESYFKFITEEAKRRGKDKQD
ncbi:helix-turn-helix domain-containing protein [Pontibacillus salipaludis]|uniref:HTH cro/C1-type domain-containing protein n=1 Tax=Pontibacillus salipaludis TaxID=1697394 RepID=A0ABQ1PVH5_9BACI|nr:helix-turn-helix transcriptional regulator [Pontibacillus salipaludis]GGD05118.1 hypothetical protein GCM10011389_10760 [Pontibacillus salipaludis]